MFYRDMPGLRGSSALAGLRRLSTILAAMAALGTGAQAATEDARDIAVITPVLNNVLENERSGVEIPWSNPATGRAGTIRVERTFYRGLQPCRDYLRTTTGGGPGYRVRGIGCRLGRLNWGLEETRLEDPPPAAASPAADPAPKTADSGAKTARDASTRVDSPSGEPASVRPPRKPAAPEPPALHYSLPARSQP